jgi:hypothetical protein
LEALYNREGFGFMNEDHGNEGKVLEDKRRHILLEK